MDAEPARVADPIPAGGPDRGRARLALGVRAGGGRPHLRRRRPTRRLRHRRGRGLPPARRPGDGRDALTSRDGLDARGGVRAGVRCGPGQGVLRRPARFRGGP